MAASCSPLILPLWIFPRRFKNCMGSWDLLLMELNQGFYLHFVGVGGFQRIRVWGWVEISVLSPQYSEGPGRRTVCSLGWPTWEILSPKRKRLGR